MADEQYRWLDRSTAERLLRGEPLEIVDAGTRDQADRLAQALGALTAEPPPVSAELPGEADALAAFRKARTGRDGEPASLANGGRKQSATLSDTGLVHLGRAAAGRRERSRWGRPVRLGLAAAMAAGMIGGVAVAATTGMLSFAGGDPEPAASVSAPANPKRPLITPSPEGTRGGAPDAPKPDGPAGNGSPVNPDPGNDSRNKQGSGSTAQGPGSEDSRYEAGSQEWWKKVTKACRDVRDGKNLDAGRRRSLEDAASGAERVRQYCTGVLKQSEGQGDSPAEKDGKGADDSDDHDDRGGKKDGKDDGKGRDDEGGDIAPRSYMAPGSDVQRRASVPPASSGPTPDEGTPTPAPASTQSPDTGETPLPSSPSPS
ncbi:hypothetical protein G5C60_43125 [Streptomyces sp. HC44]|uniref:Extensin n=1 Tax=Streptomyces scabichelini TaxID=2711217 RepID=A0A6G4VJR0_9ACTN|nr:hypothetical protein [Streptomyces scabichelini]NGO14211.1 hypothetical protein [Streptomyces scabichelini]